ncbi:hypothetical protein [Pararhizobium haloflavum]|uniref:hypothetical protein n=1 Tax=Pararhizobium haloflavum TaxID=2037914 RepID=UPI0018E40EA6|nr:hypothetical protein [Pararhizobium haloflavum]
MSTAIAQTLDQFNRAFLGQVGDTNTVTITQEGAGNLVGEDDPVSRLNQFGDLNSITIDQYGYGNDVGSALRVGPYRANGPNQRGERNVLLIEQRNLEPSSGHRVEAVAQRAFSGRAGVGNLLEIHQASLAGEAGQRIGQAVQVAPGTGGAANVMQISQAGGDPGGIFGGNGAEQLWQWGAGNHFMLHQALGGNTLMTLSQRGTDNRAEVAMRGAGNFVDLIEQNNDVTGGPGNRARLTFLSDGNGRDDDTGPGSGSGRSGAVGGGLSDFARDFTGPRRPGQAAIVQLGSANTLSYLADGGTGNLYGFHQDGTGNDVAASAIGTGNEMAALQFGDGNTLSLTQEGAENRASVEHAGSFGSFDIIQRGGGNMVSVLASGDFINAPGAGFGGALMPAATERALAPGDIRQEGAGNSSTVRALGDAHRFAFSQSGAGNSLDLEMAGQANQALIVQDGERNGAWLRQSGRRNSASIRQ